MAKFGGTVGRAIGIALVLFTAAPPLHAQSGNASDFWTAVGRYEGGVREKSDVPDISGRYQLKGTGFDTSRHWDVTVDLKRMKTVTAPAGGILNVYHVTWNWDDGKQPGVAVLMGKRLYVAYGAEGVGLHVAAPFTLTDAEKPAWEQYRQLKAKQMKEETKGGAGSAWVKHAPWFARLVEYGDGTTAYYDIWLTPRGGYGHQFVTKMPAWSEGAYALTGVLLDDDGEQQFSKWVKVLNSTFYFWHIVPNGRNFKVFQREDAVLREGKKEDVVDGTAIELADGTIVSMMGGSWHTRLMYYDVKDNQLVGQMVELNADERASETLIPSADILAKNAKLFAQ